MPIRTNNTGLGKIIINIRPLRPNGLHRVQNKIRRNVPIRTRRTNTTLRLIHPRTKGELTNATNERHVTKAHRGVPTNCDEGKTYMSNAHHPSTVGRNLFVRDSGRRVLQYGNVGRFRPFLGKEGRGAMNVLIRRLPSSKSTTRRNNLTFRFHVRLLRWHL